MTTIYRQGDVVLEQVEKMPKGVGFESFQLSMAGETGNAHTILGKVYASFVSMPFQRYIEVGQGGALMAHPEHPMLAVPAGIYGVRRVRSYTPKGIMDAID